MIQKISVVSVCMLLLIMTTAAVYAHSAKEAPAKPKLICKPAPVEKKSAWKDSNFALGFALNTGNNRTTNLNTQLYLQYKRNLWGARLTGITDINSAKGKVNKEVYAVNTEVQRDLTTKQRQFIYMRNSAKVDRFSPYDYMIVQAVGYGYVLINKKNLTLTLQAGPGVRHSKQANTGEVRHDLIGDIDSRLVWQINERTKFTQNVHVDIGPEFTYSQATTALTTQLIGRFAVKLGFTVQDYSSLPPDSDAEFKTDTITNIAIVYNFV